MSENVKLVGSLVNGVYQISLRLSNSSSEPITGDWRVEVPPPARLSSTPEGKLNLPSDESDVVAGSWELKTSGLATHFLNQLPHLTIKASVIFQGSSDTWQDGDIQTLDQLVK